MDERSQDQAESKHSNSFWQKEGVNRLLRALFWTVGGLVIYLVVVTVVLLYGWGFNGKTLFDWMDILIFPAVLAVGVYLLNLRQGQRERVADERRRQRELEVESQRAQDVALQTYLDQMSHLLLEKGLRKSQEDDEVRTLARARTLTALAMLDPERKGSLLSFLYEANLIDKANPVIRLGGLAILNFLAGAADLTKIHLSFAYLGEADLSGTNMHKASLPFSHLPKANLSESDLSNADLEYANLAEADLSHALITDANLTATKLNGATATGATLWKSKLIEADFTGANLQNADFAASISAAWTGEMADIGDADLTNANLTEADLRDAIITEEQLAQCASLKGATMPDGSKYD